MSNYDPFAEIEINETEPKQEGQKIASLVLDPVREKFYAMRELASNNPDSWNDAKLFYRQGKFMENFADDCDKFVPLAMYSPSYQRLGYDHLRTYFSWRTKVRQGIFPQEEITLSYVFLYVYELLSNIGVTDPMDGLDKILSLWHGYGAKFAALDKYIPQWLQDYHVYYTLPHTFEAFVQQHNLQQFYREFSMFDLNPDTTFESWLGTSTYEISKSEFYASNTELMRLAFSDGMIMLENHMKTLDFTFAELFCQKWNMSTWRPFISAVFYPWQKQEDRVVQLSPSNVYKLDGGVWTTSLLVPYKHMNDLAGYFLKQTEIFLRQILKYKKLSPPGVAKLLQAKTRFLEMGTSLEALTALLEKSVANSYRNFNRVVVEVDARSLSRIRQEADVTQEKLIVEEKEAAIVSVPVAPEKPADPVENDSPWAALKAALTQTELAALKIALQNPSDIKQFANDNGIMLEVLGDGINEKAMDAIGDNILEVTDEIEIYPEYEPNIRELFGG